MAPVRISKFRHVHGSSAPKERSQAALPRRQPTGRGTPGQHPAPAERRPAAPRTGRCYENTVNAPAASPDSNGIDGNNNYFAIPWQVSAPRPAPRAPRPDPHAPLSAARHDSCAAAVPHRAPALSPCVHASQGGGGPFTIIPLSATGRAAALPNLFQGHSGPVQVRRLSAPSPCQRALQAAPCRLVRVCRLSVSARSAPFVSSAGPGLLAIRAERDRVRERGHDRARVELRRRARRGPTPPAFLVLSGHAASLTPY